MEYGNLYQRWKEAGDKVEIRHNGRTFIKGIARDEERIRKYVISLCKRDKKQGEKRRAKTAKKRQNIKKPCDKYTIVKCPKFKSWSKLLEGDEISYTFGRGQKQTFKKGDPGDEEKLLQTIYAIRVRNFNQYQESKNKTEDKKNVKGENKKVVECVHDEDVADDDRDGMLTSKQRRKKGTAGKKRRSGNNGDLFGGNDEFGGDVFDVASDVNEEEATGTGMAAVEEMGMAVTAMGMLEEDGDSSSDGERWATP